MNTERLEFIDFAKGFAILSIVFFHYCQPYTTGIWSQAIMIGGTGVHLFFVLSGFGLGLSPHRIGGFTFYKKRFLKVVVPYYFAILVIYGAAKAFHLYDNDSFYALCGHIFFYKMFDEKIIGSFGYHFWFVSSIIQFYISFPLIMGIKNKFSQNKFVVLSIVVSATYWATISLLGISHLRIWNSFFLQYVWEFNIGIVLAERYRDTGEKIWDQSVAVLTFIGTSGIAIMALMAIKGGRLGQTFNDVPASIGFFSLAALSYIIFSKIPRIANAIVFTGTLSYELYLTHMLVFVFVNKYVIRSIFSNPNIFTSLGIGFPLSVVVAILFTSGMQIFYQKNQRIFSRCFSGTQ